MHVLVTGATGNVGVNVVRELRSRGTRVRALVRDADRARTLLGEQVELVAADFGDSRALRRAVDGVDAVFLASADGPGKVEFERAVVDLAGAGWARVVKLSSMHAEAGSWVGFWDAHGRIEDHLRASGVPAVVLRGNFFMSNLLTLAEAVRATGKLFAPMADAKVAMVDPRDVAACAAALLVDERHDRPVYTATGPEAVTYHDVAAALSDATGRSVEYVPVPDAAAREQLTASGAPAWLVDSVLALSGALRDGAGADVTDVVRELTGRPARDVATFARDHAAAFAG